MGVLASDISWGAYQTYEGPFFRGTLGYNLPEEPTEAHRRLRVLTATEGGHYDAINMYDRCIVSVGLIQWCEARYYLVSKLLHEVAERLGSQAITVPLAPVLELVGGEFKKNPAGRWRFHWTDHRGEVNTVEKQQQFFLGCNGLKGSWTPTAKARARLWAACLANVWQDPAAREVQALYTADRLTSFLLREGRTILWDESIDDRGWPGMLRAAYLSFAGNLPAVANKHLQVAVKALTSPKWSPEWCIGVLRELTFGPNIKIYPHRYEAIRPWLERLWEGIELPKTAEELRLWSEPQPKLEPEPPVIVEPEPVEEPPVIIEPEPPVTVEPGPVKEEADGGLVVRDPVPIDLPRDVQTPQGVLGWLLYILSTIMNFFLRRRTNG